MTRSLMRARLSAWRDFSRARAAAARNQGGGRQGAARQGVGEQSDAEKTEGQQPGADEATHAGFEADQLQGLLAKHHQGGHRGPEQHGAGLRQHAHRRHGDDEQQAHAAGVAAGQIHEQAQAGQVGDDLAHHLALEGLFAPDQRPAEQQGAEEIGGAGQGEENGMVQPGKRLAGQQPRQPQRAGQEQPKMIEMDQGPPETVRITGGGNIRNRRGDVHRNSRNAPR